MVAHNSLKLQRYKKTDYLNEIIRFFRYMGIAYFLSTIILPVTLLPSSRSTLTT